MTFGFVLRNADGPLYEGNVEALNCPAEEGRLGVLPGMAPSIVRLQRGALHIFEKENSAPQVFEIGPGMLHITPTQVTILI